MMTLTRKGFLGSAAAAAALGPTLAGAAPARARGAPRPTLIRGVDVITMSAAGELRGVDVLIDGGRVAAIGRALSASAAEVVDAKGMILMPGMVDGHRHVWQSLQAGSVTKTMPDYGERYNASKLKTMVCFTPEEMEFANYSGGVLALDSGVTSVIDYAHVQYTPELASAGARGLKNSGIGGWYCWQTSHTPKYGPRTSVSLKEAMAQRAAAPEAWRYEHARRMRETIFADETAPLQFGLALSVEPWSRAKQAAEIGACRAAGAKMIAQHYSTPENPPAGAYRGILDLADAGLLGPDLHFDHANNITAAELALLRDTGGTTCSTVIGEFPYADPPSHWRARKAGVAAGIGIDVALAVTSDYFETVRGAYWSMFRSREGAAETKNYRAEDVLDFATRLGAKSLRMGEVAGVIAQGRRADLVLLRTDRAGFAPHGPLAERVVNFAGWADVDSVWVAGVAKKRQGRMIGVDMARLKARQMQIHERTAALAETVVLT